MFQILRRMREFSRTPVIMLSAKTDTSDKVEAFELGANDYITKPFNTEELVARVKAATIYSSAGISAKDKPDFEDEYLKVELAKRLVTVNGRKQNLTPMEYSLLRELIHEKTVVEYRHILSRVWGVGYRDEHELVHTLVKRLRSKIEPDPRNPMYILTVEGIGYRFKD
jgi:two-component system KDP operon response regulator KdpE